MMADAPLVAMVCILVADLLGAAMMVPKTYRDPDSETLSTYALASLSGALAAGAVGGLAPALLIYPVYFCLVNGGDPDRSPSQRSRASRTVTRRPAGGRGRRSGRRVRRR